MLLCLAKTDDVRLIASLCVGHMHNDAIKPPEQIDSLLTIGFPGIFPSDDWSIEDSLATNEVKSVAFDVAEAFRFVPGRHALIVATPSAAGEVYL
jgi:hypothetical protein